MRRHERGEASVYNVSFWLVILGILIFEALGGGGIFVEPAKAVRALENQGFTEINIREKQVYFIGWRGCDQTDSARFVGTAKNPVGKVVPVSVCAGVFKGATIRTD